MLMAFSSEPGISVASILSIASFTRPLSEEPDIKRSAVLEADMTVYLAPSLLLTYSAACSFATSSFVSSPE